MENRWTKMTVTTLDTFAGKREWLVEFDWANSTVTCTRRPYGKSHPHHSHTGPNHTWQLSANLDRVIVCDGPVASTARETTQLVDAIDQWLAMRLEDQDQSHDYVVADTFFDSAAEAALASVEMFVTANGKNTDPLEIDEYMDQPDMDIVGDMVDADWDPPSGCNWTDMKQAVRAYRDKLDAEHKATFREAYESSTRLRNRGGYQGPIPGDK